MTSLMIATSIVMLICEREHYSDFDAASHAFGLAGDRRGQPLRALPAARRGQPLVRGSTQAFIDAVAAAWSCP
jgi:hypothetical protein